MLYSAWPNLQQGTPWQRLVQLLPRPQTAGTSSESFLIPILHYRCCCKCSDGKSVTYRWASGVCGLVSAVVKADLSFCSNSDQVWRLTEIPRNNDCACEECNCLDQDLQGRKERKALNARAVHHTARQGGGSGEDR